jgi:hypothetical protein
MFIQRKLRGQRFYTDTVIGKYKLVTNNTCAQLFANESYFVKAYPMEKKSLASAALCQFIRDFGVPEQLMFDGSGEETGPKMEFMKHVFVLLITMSKSLTGHSRTKWKPLYKK